MTERRRKRPLTADHFGIRLSEWRARKRESQLDLASAANISQRHLSFVESGRTLPSRDMVIRLCEVLDIPLRARNELLASAGYAALYQERPLDVLAMEGVRDALLRMISHHEPYPAFVVDRTWRVVSNQSASRLIAACFTPPKLQSLSADGAFNLMRVMFEPTEMRPRILNWAQVAPRLLMRMRNEARGDATSPSMALLREMEPSAGHDPAVDDQNYLELPMVPVELRLSDTILRLFNTITTFGTPQDVGLQELRIEMSYPVDAATRAFFTESGWSMADR
jgi:transcriptional regulator with XRE-family HTH domain